MVFSGGRGLWRRAVVEGGGRGLWRRAVVEGGGGWWRWVVVVVGGGGGRRAGAALKEAVDGKKHSQSSWSPCRRCTETDRGHTRLE